MIVHSNPELFAAWVNSFDERIYRKLGFERYQTSSFVLWLVPFEWYFLIPDGTLIKWINGVVTEFKNGVTDSEINYNSSLAFAIYSDKNKIVKSLTRKKGKK